MALSLDELKRAEAEIEEREQAIREEEAQLREQELALGEMEAGFIKRSNMLSNLAGYVTEQEQSLIARANAMGPEALALAQTTIAGGGTLEADSPDLVGALRARQRIVEQRQELLDTRLELAEERTRLYASRMEAVDTVESRFEELQGQILEHEKKLAETLRQLMTGAASLSSVAEPQSKPKPKPAPKAKPAPVAAPEPEPEPEPQPEPEPEPEAADEFDLPIVSAEELAQEAGPSKQEATLAMEGTEPVAVVSGSGSGLGHSPDLTGPHSPAEDRATDARVNAETGDGFNILLEADLTGNSQHAFFRYADDEPDELPGLFLATDRRILVDRRIMLSIRLDADAPIETVGIVSYLHDGNAEEGPAVTGMYIEIVSLEPPDIARVSSFLAHNDPLII